MRRPSLYRVVAHRRSESQVHRVLALFTPAGDGTWSLRLVSEHPAAFRLPGVDAAGRLPGLRRPELDSLNRSMLRAHAGYVVRLHPAGAIEISATDRSAEVLNEWLMGIAAEATGHGKST